MSNQRNDEDRALLARISGQDKGAFELLYRRYYGQVFHFIIRMIRQRELAEEVVDDTLFAVWRTSDSFQGRSSVSTWIFGIAYRQGLTAISRQSRRSEIESDEQALATMVASEGQSDPNSSHDTTELLSQMSRAVASLSTDHQAVVELAAIGHNATEIGQIVQCSPATARTRLFHARRKLKAYLAESDDTIQATRTGTNDE
jgi:RNA polymerase sigma-70 factor (ECF subfamily)